MEITSPTLRATRFSQLKPGELFMFALKSASAVALAAADPTKDGDMVMAPLSHAKWLRVSSMRSRWKYCRWEPTMKFGCPPMLEVGQSKRRRRTSLASSFPRRARRTSGCSYEPISAPRLSLGQATST
jgi:hypothetical protein